MQNFLCGRRVGQIEATMIKTIGSYTVTIRQLAYGWYGWTAVSGTDYQHGMIPASDMAQAMDAVELVITELTRCTS